jgi:hypothetical protein
MALLNLKLGTHRYVLADIDPIKKGLLSRLRHSRRGRLRNQLILLNQRVFKSGDNSEQDELIKLAYIRTGKLILRHRFV